MTLKQTKQRGFTIVELLIVVVIIAILAAITIVAYNGIQLPENLYPKYFELHYGGKRTSPDELTQVSDSGK